MAVDIKHPPAGGFQNGGWYWDPSVGAARQYFNGSFGAPSTISNPGQQGFGQTVTNAPATQTGTTDVVQTPENIRDNFIKQTLDSLTKPFQDQLSRATEFDKKNPFAFDESLASASAKERLDPYYTAELNDYVSGVNRAKGKTTQDTQRLLGELSTSTDQATGAIKQNTEEAVRNAQEGYANSGLLSSGAQERAAGMADVQGNNQLASTIQSATGKQAAITSNATDSNANLEASLNTYQRRMNAEKDTALTNDVTQQKQDALQRYELERQQFIGGPGKDSFSSLSSIYGLS